MNKVEQFPGWEERKEPPDDPLVKYYRVPGVHVRLPTNGAFIPGMIEFTMTGDIPVYPMRAADELLLKSADALMSGYAIEELIKSCVPAIKKPRLISSPDLDVILLAIRAATYGEILTVEPSCPECGKETEIHISLPRMLATTKPVESENPVRLSDEVVVFLRPYNMDNATQVGVVSFEETRKVQAMEEADEPTRSKQINQSMSRIVNLSFDMLASAILKIVVKEGEVKDPVSIRKFIANVGKGWVDKLQAKMEEMNACGIDKHYDATCGHCGHQWHPEIEFNPATFFDSAS